MSDTQNIVVEVFAELTRYPVELLEPEANLEGDLGIDSVKRTEILASLQRRFDLPADLPPPAEGLASIAAVARYIDDARSGKLVPAASPAVAAAPAEPPPRPEPRKSAIVPDFAPPTPYSPPPEAPIDGLSWAAQAPARPAAPAPAPSEGRQAVLEALHDVIGEALHRAHSTPARPKKGRFDGRIALVTGSGRGLGRVLAQRLAADGATVIVNSFHSRDEGERCAREIAEQGGQAVHLWGSVAKREHLERIFKEIDQRFGGLDFFISNASNGVLAPLNQVEEEHWDRSFRTNVMGLHRGAMLAAPLMAARGGGRIVAISSPGAQRYIEHFGCQGPIKAAMESLIRYLAVELGPQNIQVNAISAGPLYGDLLNHYPNADRLIPYWESRTPMRRLGTEEHIAEAVLTLLTPAALAFSGAVLLADNTGTLRV